VPEAIYETVTALGRRRRVLWQALRRDGLRGWRQARSFHQLCAELAFKKLQRRKQEDEPGLQEEIARLRSEVRKLVEMHSKRAPDQIGD